MRNSGKDLPIILKHNEILCEFYFENFVRRFEYPKEEHFSFMLLCFLNIQGEHLQAVLKLVKEEHYSDAIIISRNMIEGSGIINWVSKTPDERALLWKKYSVVTDFRIALKIHNNDKSKIDPLILQRLETEGEIFLREKYKKPDVQKNNLPIDPYKQFWCFEEDGTEVKVYKLFDGQNKVLYELYNDMSDIVHWNISRIGTRINRDGSEVEFSANPKKDGCLALSSAFQSMFYLLNISNIQLKLDHGKKLQIIYNNFINELNM